MHRLLSFFILTISLSHFTQAQFDLSDIFPLPGTGNTATGSGTGAGTGTGTGTAGGGASTTVSRTPLGSVTNPTSSSATQTSVPASSSSSSISSAPSSSSSGTSTPTSSSGTTSIPVKTITSVITNPDGSQSTQTSVESSSTPSSSATAAASNGGDKKSGSGKTWGIVGGVVGGIAVLGAALFVVWRCTQRRFSDLDADGENIKWPELQPEGHSSTTVLNPSATHRREGVAGVGDEEWDEKYRGSQRGSFIGGGGSQRGSFIGGMSGGGQSWDYERIQQAQAGTVGYRGDHYDPYNPSTHSGTPPPLYPPRPSPQQPQQGYFAPTPEQQQGHFTPPRILSPPPTVGALPASFDSPPRVATPELSFDSRPAPL